MLWLCFIVTHPAKIVEMSTSKTGKHGSAKCHLIGLDIFTGKKIEGLFGSTDDVTLPDLDKVDMLVRVVSRVCVCVMCVCACVCDVVC